MKDTESNNIDDESVDQLSPIQQLAECPTAYNKTIINSYTQRNIVWIMMYSQVSITDNTIQQPT